MNVSRSYFLIGTLFLLCGICIGMYMGAAGDFRLAAAHAHINLVGFALLMIFGLVYRVVPAMGRSPLALVQLWLHGLGAAVLVILLVLLELGRISEATMAVSVVPEVAILLGVVLFLVNLLRNSSQPSSSHDADRQRMAPAE